MEGGKPGPKPKPKPQNASSKVSKKASLKKASKAFPDEDVTSRVLDHILNRRVARLKGFKYLRIVPISRVANSCSGGMTEKMGVEYLRSPYMVKKNKEDLSFIQYADLADVVKMLNLKTGGSIQDGVREAIRLIEGA